MNPELKRAAELADEYIASFDHHKVSEKPHPEALRKRLHKELTDDGLPPLQVIDELAEDAREGLLNTGGGRFFGWVIGGGIPVSIAADWLTSAWDQNAAAYACAPSAAIIEEVAADWLKDILGLPEQASFAFVTGCQMAHFTALAAARHSLVGRQGLVRRNTGPGRQPADPRAGRRTPRNPVARTGATSVSAPMRSCRSQCTRTVRSMSARLTGRTGKEPGHANHRVTRRW